MLARITFLSTRDDRSVMVLKIRNLFKVANSCGSRLAGGFLTEIRVVFCFASAISDRANKSCIYRERKEQILCCVLLLIPVRATNPEQDLNPTLINNWIIE